MKSRIVLLIFVIGVLSSIYYYYPRKKYNLNQQHMIIAGIFHNGYQVWNMNLRKEAEKRIFNNGGYEFDYIDVKQSNTLFMQRLNEVIEREVDGVIISIPDQSLSEIVVNKLETANIPFVTVDTMLLNKKGKLIAPWFGVEGFTVGKENAKWLANYVNENSLIDDKTGLLILTIDKFSNIRERTKGQYETFTKLVPEFSKEKIFFMNYNGEMEYGYFRAMQVFMENKDVDKWLVMGGNEEGVIGAVKALEELGKDKDAVAIGIGGYLAKEEFKKKSSALKASSYYYAEDVSGRATDFLIKKIYYDERIPMRMSAFSRIITKENFIRVMGEYSN